MSTWDTILECHENTISSDSHSPTPLGVSELCQDQTPPARLPWVTLPLQHSGSFKQTDGSIGVDEVRQPVHLYELAHLFREPRRAGDTGAQALTLK